ncbi:MAG: hypothetical protein KJ077_12430 [Anaerolineae bacterium]|nr:hypothetical protein [Anaerolineae bacterium]
MTDKVIVSFAATPELRDLLKLWAKQDDRTVSATLRQILEREARRRQAQPETQKPVNQSH